MRDVEGWLTEVVVKAPTGLHALTGAGSNAEATDEARLPAPEMPLLVRHTDKTVAHLIERHVEYAIATDTAERTVALHPLFVPHYMQFRASAAAGRQRDRHRAAGPAERHIAGQAGPRSGASARLSHRPTPARGHPAAGEDHPAASLAATRFLLDDWLIDVTTDLAGKMMLIAIALSIIERVLLPERPAYFVTAGRRGGGKTTAILMTVAGDRPAAARRGLVALRGGAAQSAVRLSLPGDRRAGLGQHPARPGDLVPIDREVADDADLFRPCPRRDRLPCGAPARRSSYSTAIASRRSATSPRVRCRSGSTSTGPIRRTASLPTPIRWAGRSRIAARSLRALYTILLGNPRLAGGEQEPAKTRFRPWWHLVRCAARARRRLTGGGAGHAPRASIEAAHKHRRAARLRRAVPRLRGQRRPGQRAGRPAGLLDDAMVARRVSRRLPRRPGRRTRMLDNGVGPRRHAQELRGLLEHRRRARCARGHRTFSRHRLRLVADNPAVAGSEVLILRKRANRGGQAPAGLYRIERKRQP